MEKHITLLGFLYLTFHIIALFGVIMIAIAFIGVGIFGHISLRFLDHSLPNMPFGLLGLVGWMIGGAMLVLALPGIIAGAGLLRFKPWARVLALIIAAFHLFNFPFGTALAVYAFWALLSRESASIFN